MTPRSSIVCAGTCSEVSAPLHGESFADTLGNSLYSAEHRHDPERLLGMPEAGAGASEYYVRSDRELEAAPEAKALHCCNCQDWKPLPLIDRAETLFEGRAQLLRTQSGPRNDISSVAEVRSFG